MLKLIKFLWWDIKPPRGITNYRIASEFDPNKDMVGLEFSRELAFSQCALDEQEYLESRLEH